MFGYVRAYKPYLRMCEYDTYRGIYCGLCKTMGREFGTVSRFTLSYDFAFLCVMNMSVNKIKVTGGMQRCIAHPLKKTPCADRSEGLIYPANAAIILTYHKLRDDLADRGLKDKTEAACALPFFKGSYKKARMNYPILADNIEKAMVMQKNIEDAQTAGIDQACEPTALIMQAICEELSCDNDVKPLLRRFGYLLGRYIYLCDALDDAPEDYQKGNYNPLLMSIEHDEKHETLPDEHYKKLCDMCSDSISFTLGELAETYVKLDIQMYKPILDNIIYLGLKNIFEQIKNRTFHKSKRSQS